MPKDAQHHAHTGHRIFIVIYDQHLASSGGSSAFRWGRKGRLESWKAAGFGKTHNKLAPFTLPFAMRLDRTTMHLRQVFGQGQADAEAALRVLQRALYL